MGRRGLRGLVVTVTQLQDLTIIDIAEFERRVGHTLWAGPVAVVISSADSGLILAVNNAFCHTFEYTSEELVGRRSTELGLWAQPSDRERVLSPAIEGSWLPFTETQLRTATGEIRTVLCAVTQVGFDAQRIIATQIYDVTERRQTEDRLRILNRVARLGYEANDADTIMHGTLAALTSLFPEVRVGYGTFESERRIRMEATAGPSAMPEQSDMVVDLENAPGYTEAILIGEPIVVTDVWSDPLVSSLGELWHDYEVGAILDVPVRRGGQTVGILCLDSPHPRRWSDHELATMQEVAALLAVSIFRARAEEELRTERELLQTMMDNVPDFLYIKDVQSRFTRANPAIASFLGVHDPAELIGKSDFDFFPESLANRFYADEQAVIASGEAVFNQLEPQNEAETVWALTTTVPVKDVNGNVVSLVGTARDVSERHEMEAALRISEARQRALLEAIPDIVAQFDREGVYLDLRINPSSRFWVSSGSRIGRSLSEFVPEHVSVSIIRAIGEALDSGGVATVEYEFDHGGVLFTFEMRIAPSGEGEVVAIGRDITERKLLEQRLAYQATHDPLTGLPNRAYFTNRLNAALDRAREDDAPVAVFFIDLDNFKEINDHFGHATGDRLLAAIGERLRRSIRDGDIVARVGGDEFAVLLDDVEHKGEVETIARRIADRIGRPVRLGRQMARTTASVGIAVGMPAERRAADLLEAADHAMYSAKRDGKARLAIISIENGNAISFGCSPVDLKTGPLGDASPQTSLSSPAKRVTQFAPMRSGQTRIRPAVPADVYVTARSRRSSRAMISPSSISPVGTKPKSA
jgi:diguanylate cyclase (GGDEF)-like protein/PAS domain S-box-containing protein